MLELRWFLVSELPGFLRDRSHAPATETNHEGTMTRRALREEEEEESICVSAKGVPA
jgi:hypothetical protein